jgi:hypothetical protein
MASPCHGSLHLALIETLQPTRALEIGSGYGRSTMFIALGLHRLGGARILDSVDIDHTITRQAVERFDTGSVQVTLHQLRSDEFFRNHEDRYDYIFIDGDHSYAGFKADFEAARQRLSERGLIVFDDALFHDITNVLRDLNVPCCILDRETGFGLYTATLEQHRLYTAPLIKADHDVNPYVGPEVAAFRLAYRLSRVIMWLTVFGSRTKRRVKKVFSLGRGPKP